MRPATPVERDPVAIYGILGCGRCFACLRGRDNECRTVPVGGIGLSRDGGMAEYVVVPAEQLRPIGELDVAQAAPLTDAHCNNPIDPSHDGPRIYTSHEFFRLGN